MQAGAPAAEAFSTGGVDCTVALRIFSTFRWGAQPGMVDCRTSIAVDGWVLGPWTPDGFDFRLATTPGPHRLHVTAPTSFLGRLMGSWWRRPEITTEFRSPGWYDCELLPVTNGRDGRYWWRVSQR